MEPDPILPYIQFEEEGIFGSTGHPVSDAYPSTASSSTGESSDPRMVWSATRILGSSNTSRDWMQQQESSPAFADDLDATGVISPQIEQDLLQSDPFTELAQPDHEGFLNPFFEPGNTFTRNHNNAPPWAHYDELDTNHVHRRAYGPETVYLNVPTYVDRLGSRATTPGGPSDTASAVSSENVNTRLETRPRRGGRQSGMNLSRESVQNIRRVRDIGGACLRCEALKEKCSEGKPCISCSSTQGRKWDGCVRSFKELVDVFKPEILATRLQPQALTGFMSYHTLRRYGQDDFDLPLHFGFGRPFYGFKGAEYNPMTTEIQFSHVVGPSDQHPESALYGYSLPVYPSNSNSGNVQKYVMNWLKQTLRSRSDMEGWLRVCFGAEDVGWIRELLLVTWEYSVQSWKTRKSRQDELQLDKNLSYTWMLALVTTMLSLPVSIPSDAQLGVMNNLRFLVADKTYLNSSRPINKCVKSLLFDLYRQFVEKVMSALEAFKRTNSKKISECHLCHVHCMTILVVATSSYLQTSLMDNYRLPAEREISDLRETTFSYIRDVETAFKNTVLHVRHRKSDWLRERTRRAGNGSRDIPMFLDKINEIGNNHMQEISAHRTAKLETLLNPSLPFHHANMQRVFAFYFDPSPIRAQGRSR